MTAQLIDNTTTTDVIITINAPFAAVDDAIGDVASEMGFASVSGKTEVEFIADVTKQWWFDFAKKAAIKKIELAAQQAAEATKAAGLAQLESSPLLGA
jgi:hypothetical protein